MKVKWLDAHTKYYTHLDAFVGALLNKGIDDKELGCLLIVLNNLNGICSTSSCMGHEGYRMGRTGSPFIVLQSSKEVFPEVMKVLMLLKEDLNIFQMIIFFQEIGDECIPNIRIDLKQGEDLARFVCDLYINLKDRIGFDNSMLDAIEYYNNNLDEEKLKILDSYMQ